MYLYSKLQSLNKDISICFIGCGKFISMFLSQYNQLQKIKISTIVDINQGSDIIGLSYIKDVKYISFSLP